MKKIIKFIPLLLIPFMTSCGYKGEKSYDGFLNKAVLDNNAYSYVTKTGTFLRDITFEPSDIIVSIGSNSSFLEVNKGTSISLVSVAQSRVVETFDNPADSITYDFITVSDLEYLTLLHEDTLGGFIKYKIFDYLGNLILEITNKDDFDLITPTITLKNLAIDGSYETYFVLTYGSEGKIKETYYTYSNGSVVRVDALPQETIGFSLKNYGYNGYSFNFVNNWVELYKNNKLENKFFTHLRYDSSLTPFALVGKYFYYQEFIPVSPKSEEYDFFNSNDGQKYLFNTYKIDLINGYEQKIDTDIVMQTAYEYRDEFGVFNLLNVVGYKISKNQVLSSVTENFIVDRNFTYVKMDRDFILEDVFKLGPNYVSNTSGIIVNAYLEVVNALPHFYSDYGQSFFGNYAFVENNNGLFGIYDYNGLLVSEHLWSTYISPISSNDYVYMYDDAYQMYKLNAKTGDITVSNVLNFYGFSGLNVRSTDSLISGIYSYETQVAILLPTETVTEYVSFEKISGYSYSTQSYEVVLIYDSLTGCKRLMSVDSYYLNILAGGVL